MSIKNIFVFLRHQDAIPFHKYMKINGIDQDIYYLLTER